MGKLKVVTVLGTRPEIIRLSSVIRRLDETFDHKLAHTGQNYDYELSEIFFNEMNVRKPDFFMKTDTSSLGRVYGTVLIESEEMFRRERPDALLVLGDTNSAIAAIMAKRMKITIFHMEAGNRCFDENVPEETNRRIVDHIADFNLVYSERARQQLLSEGIPHRRIYLTGSPLREVIDANAEKIAASDVLERMGLAQGGYLLLSAHREENVDSKASLRKVMDAVSACAQRLDMPVIVSAHPRTRKRLEAFGLDKVSGQIKFTKPFGYFDYMKLQMNAYCAVSDSGTISEESAMLGFPAVTLRNAMERPEALDSGSIIITGLDAQILFQAVELARSDHEKGRRPAAPAEYQITNTSQRVARLIMGLAKLNRRWSNLDDGLGAE